MTRYHLWRYLAHRTGLLLSPSLLFSGVPFSNRWHRARILARKGAAPVTDQPPRDAYEAARQLADQGHHVHLIAENEARCYTGHCTPGNHR
ncbi:hypothetical protein [Streptomyces sp. NBC_01180]|uniref:hypothetical protein n=1 Tax=Streptomyces sp. NBC_01180 TaxID=2903763 RepID=UPI00386424E4|nr:hypothetical protein OG708_17685 [Streptomyces sp. NBC_01180]